MELPTIVFSEYRKIILLFWKKILQIQELL
jgi:hypothetical protein